MFVRMIVRLFSIFDPCGILGISLNWRSVVLFIVFGWGCRWGKVGLRRIQWKGCSTLIQELVSVIRTQSKSVCLIIPLFISILMYNVMGLMPYVFTSTRHGVVTVALALPL